MNASWGMGKSCRYPKERQNNFPMISTNPNISLLIFLIHHRKRVTFNHSGGGIPEIFLT
jgi:hypothetical protein